MDMEACPITCLPTTPQLCPFPLASSQTQPPARTTAPVAPNAPSSICSPVDAITDGTSLAIVVAFLALLACSSKREALLWCHP
jgi:hypothetical protein